jgi:hypothetical protein
VASQTELTVQLPAQERLNLVVGISTFTVNKIVGDLQTLPALVWMQDQVHVDHLLSHSYDKHDQKLSLGGLFEVEEISKGNSLDQFQLFLEEANSILSLFFG